MPVNENSEDKMPDATGKGITPPPGPEPPMYLQRPSSARSQDISHVLARTFRDLFMKETVGSDTVHYLTKSRGGDDDYHERYVAALEKVQTERDRRLAEASMLERHIMRAQARAMSADERVLSRASSGVSNFPDLGLPPARVHFRSCLDNELMQKHNLITPDDFVSEEIPIVPAPQASPVPHYARQTESSSRGNRADGGERLQTPLPSLQDAVRSLESCSDVESEHPIVVQTKNAKNRYKNLWREQMQPEEREKCRNDIAVLQSKVDFLKNPRHAPPSPSGTRTLIKPFKKKPKEVGIMSTPDNECIKEPAAIFVPSPSEIVFTDYKVGQVYELTLELKNVSTVLRPVRVIPPKTLYFAVGLGQFPGEHGLVAAGMSCYYTLRFSPDSLVDFDDVLVVQTQSSSPLNVSLKGRRPAPVLSMPEVLDVGECLTGGTKVARIPLINTGGPGRFCLVSAASWPATNFKSTVKIGNMSLPPFEIRPTTMELRQGQSTFLEVMFSPEAEQVYTAEFVMICDNCQIKHITLRGEGKTVGIELVSVEGGLSIPAAAELSDATAQHLINFDTLNPYTYYQKSVVIRNKVNIDLMFNWQVVKPHIQPPDPAASEESESNHQMAVAERTLDLDSPFSVDPPEGILPALKDVEFTVTFAPPMVSAFHSVLHMILKGVPLSASSTDGSRPSSSVHSASDMSLPARSTDSLVGIQDVTVLEVEVKGTCEPFSVLLQPYAVYIPGHLLINTPTKRTFRMINASVSSIVFEWERCNDGYIIQVEPPLGELEAQSEYDFEVTVSSALPGKISHTLQCHVHHLDQSLTLLVEAEIKGPEVIIENTDINFDLVRLGSKVEREVTVRNLSQVSAKWSIQQSPDHIDPVQAESEFKFYPECGELRPLDLTTIRVIFDPRKCCTVRTVFQLRVEDGNELSVNVLGEVQRPEACLMSCVLHMPEVYLNIPVQHKITLLNKTLLPTTFKWLQAEGSQTKDTQVVMEPNEGLLGPRQELQVLINFTSLIQGQISDIQVPCQVAGMNELLWLSLNCNVHGLSVVYSSPQVPGQNGRSSELVVEFGDVRLGETQCRELVIENKTGIAAPYTLIMEHFYTRPPTPPGLRPAANNKISQRRGLLGRTPNLANPLSKTPNKAQADVAKAMLQMGKGASFTLTPDRGVLQPFSKQVVEVQAFSDMWGSYQDNIIATVEGEQVVRIPVTMTVSGCPVNFQMVAAKPDQKPILRFGTHVSGAKPIMRQLRINNPSPVEVRVNWQVFMKDDKDDQLLDLITAFGESFPLLDASGQEMVPPEEMDSARTTKPTGLIPDSADTTPALSRVSTTVAGHHDDEPSIISHHDEEPSIVSLFVREHRGKLSTAPFEIVPSQIVLPARGSGFINVKFSPLSSGDVGHGLACTSFAHGFFSLNDEVVKVEGQFSRLHGYSVTPLHLEMTANIKPALLAIECEEDEGMAYRAAASDFLDNDQLEEEKLHICCATLSNRTETTLTFRLICNKPFFLVELTPVSKQPTAQLVRSDFTALQPQQNALVRVAFRVSRDVLSFVNLINNEPEKEMENVSLEVNGRERRLVFKQDLVVQFDNGTTQHLPLHASLTLPSLELSRESLDFGICYVGQRRELQLTLSNPTTSDAYWAVSTEHKSDTCEDTTFEVEPSSGKLDAFITHACNNKVLLRIYFTARHNDNYEAVFLFHGMLGEEPQRLFLRGEGSYDGKHEALVNI